MWYEGLDSNEKGCSVVAVSRGVMDIGYEQIAAGQKTLGSKQDYGHAM